MKTLNRILSSGLATIMMVTLLSTTAFAATSPIENDKNIFDILQSTETGISTTSADSEITYTITDPTVIAQLSNAEALPTRIELTYIPAQSDDFVAETSMIDSVSPHFFESYKLQNTKDRGDGWYNSTSHQLYEFYVDGPDTFKIDKSEEFSASATCNISAAIDVINAGVGFTIGEKHTLNIQSNTPVSSGERLHVEIFRTHHKVTFDLYEMPLGGNWAKKGSYEAINPNGIFIKKEFWKM